MMKTYECDWCGTIFDRLECYMKGKKHAFCSRQCLADFSSKSKNPAKFADLKDFKNIRSHMTRLNEEQNPTRKTQEVRAKLRDARLGKGECKGYSKIYGRLAHRVVAEQTLGRPLTQNEVVHHRDGNRYNNEPENLVVFPTLGDHSRFHTELSWFVRQLKRLQEEENENS